MTELQEERMRERAAKRAARAEADARDAAGKRAKAKKLAEIEERLTTRWHCGSEKQPSCHAGGEPMRHDAWCAAERAALAKKGIAVEIVEHPSRPGWFALAKGTATAHVRAVASNVQQIVGNSGGDE